MAAPFSPATLSTSRQAPLLAPHRSAGEGAPLPFRQFGPAATVRRFPAFATMDSAATPVDAKLDELRSRNHWLQYAAVGLAAWSVAATYAAITYQGEERADLHQQIKSLKASLFDIQSRSADVLEVAYRQEQGSRSFAEISDQLALTATPVRAQTEDAMPAAEALLAHPHPESIEAEQVVAAPQVPAQAVAQAPRNEPTNAQPSRLTMPAISTVFGLPAQYSLLAESPALKDPFALENFGPDSFGPESFGPDSFGPDSFGPAVLSERLPITPLATKLAPVSVAALSLSGKAPKTMNLRRVRRPVKRPPAAHSPSTLVASRKLPLRQQAGNVAITAYPGRSRTAPAAAQPQYSGQGQATQGEVAKLYLP